MIPLMSGFSNQVELNCIPFLLPTIGAIISGATSGNHLSPISDVTFMSSASVGAYHIDLVRAQTQTAIVSIIATAVSFLLLGLLIFHEFNTTFSIFASILLGILVNILITWIWHLITKKQLNRKAAKQ